MGKDHIHNPILKYKYIPPNIKIYKRYIHIFILKKIRIRIAVELRSTAVKIHSELQKINAHTDMSEIGKLKVNAAKRNHKMPLFLSRTRLLAQSGQCLKVTSFDPGSKTCFLRHQSFQIPLCFGLMFSGICLPEHPHEYPSVWVGERSEHRVGNAALI